MAEPSKQTKCTNHLAKPYYTAQALSSAAEDCTAIREGSQPIAAKDVEQVISRSPGGEAYPRCGLVLGQVPLFSGAISLPEWGVGPAKPS